MQFDTEIFLFIDALGWELVSKTSFLKDVLPYRRPAEMQFGYSCSAIPTILSGKTPAEHGHLSFFRFAPSASPFRRLGKLAPLLKPASFWNRGRIRGWLSRFIKWAYGYTGYFQLYQMPVAKLPMMDYCEKRDLFAQKGLGDIENLCDMLDKSGCKYHISDWHLGDSRNFKEAWKALDDGAQFLFIYTAELDALLHQYPVLVADPVQEKIDWYRREVIALLDKCRAMGRTPRLTLFSDHGMTPLTHVIDIKRAVEKTGLVFGKDYGACYDSTIFRATFLKPEAEAVIRKAVQPFEESGHWLTEEEEKRYGIYRADRWFGDAIFLTNPGVQICPSDMGNKPLNGMHGFAPEDKDSQAVILSNAEIPPEIHRMADYFGLMRRRLEEMGIPE